MFWISKKGNPPLRLVDISIHVVNWNGGEMLRQCLSTVFKQDYRAINEVLVVDNASTDHSLKTIEREFPKVKIIRNYANLGFSKAHNQAIRLSTGELILVLNFDILLDSEFVSRMVLALSGDPKIGMASGKLYRLLGGKKTDLLDSTGVILARYFSSPRGAGEKDIGQYDNLENRAIFGPCGAAAVYRREMLEDVKYQQEYFDEDFVNYVEDVDLAWRAQLRGWRGIYVPDAIAYHERGVTRKNNVVEQENYFVWGYRNRYLAMYKNVTGYEFRKFFCKIGLVEMLFLLSGKDGGVPQRVKFKAFREARLMGPLFTKKRDHVQGRIAAASEGVLAFSEYLNFSVLTFLARKLWHLVYANPKVVLHEQLIRFSLGRKILGAYQRVKGGILQK